MQETKRKTSKSISNFKTIMQYHNLDILVCKSVKFFCWMLDIKWDVLIRKKNVDVFLFFSCYVLGSGQISRSQSVWNFPH